MRRAFGLWQAIMIILLISGLMIVVLKYAAVSSKHIQNSFLREQSELFLNSAIEIALLDISLYDKEAKQKLLTESNITSVSKRNGVIEYNAHVDIVKYYLQKDTPKVKDLTYCKNTSGIECVEIKEGVAESHGMALFEVEVNASVNGKVVSRILRRTLQQP